MKNMDALTEGSVDLSKFLRYVDQQFAGTVWIPIIKKSSTDCYARVSGKTEDFRKLLMLPGFVRPEDCNIGLMAFLECTLNEIDTACPASFELNTVECKSAKEALIKCNSNIENVVMSYIGQIPAASRSA